MSNPSASDEPDAVDDGVAEGDSDGVAAEFCCLDLAAGVDSATSPADMQHSIGVL